MYIGLDELVKNSYFALYTPLVHTRWHLNMCESVEQPGIKAHRAGLFTPDILERKNLLENFSAFAQQEKVTDKKNSAFPQYRKGKY